MFICPRSVSGCNPDSDCKKSWGGKVVFGCPPDYVPENRFQPAPCPPWYRVYAQLCVNKTQPPLPENLPVRQKFLSVDSYLLCPSSFLWTCWSCGQVDIGMWVIQTNQFQMVKNINNNISIGVGEGWGWGNTVEPLEGSQKQALTNIPKLLVLFIYCIQNKWCR